jgi:hypothetical protein
MIFAEILETVSAKTFPAGGVPDVVVDSEPQESDAPAAHRLRQRIKEDAKSNSVDLKKQAEELQERLAKEQEVIKRFDDYDLQAEAKKPDFDRSEATRLQSESIVAQAVAVGIRDELAAVTKRLRSVDIEATRRSSRLSDFVERLDEIRRSTAIALIRGQGRLKQDSDWTRRWLADVANVERQLYELFPAEEDWPTVSELFETLTRYEVEPSTTAILYNNLHHTHRDQFAKFAPETDDEIDNDNEE